MSLARHGVLTVLLTALTSKQKNNWSRSKKIKQIIANRNRLKLHSLILASFFGGGIVGALGFKHVGYKMTVFLAAFLFLLAIRPILYDLRVRWRLLQLPGT